ncbi:hypothetical protein AM1_E0120 (plasmid) [Acaryochloris marina MBIC11017]|uniref:Uncharacterized protein n=1 Tax=Acaryochloris marina (strain MBIC 11017) TaxID=329726 RepID=A8ZPF3_ACAM1|nr:hypothetical protein AM1_E0120 [Acaryochloris marina MBIC11017]
MSMFLAFKKIGTGAIHRLLHLFPEMTFASFYVRGHKGSLEHGYQ